MLQANPNLTPNLIKAILQYTAQQYPGYSALRQGAGFLNTLGAVRLAKFYANPQAGDRMPVQKVWSRQILWGNHRLKGGVIKPTANAWANNVVWGAAKTHGRRGRQHRLGQRRRAGDNIVWGTAPMATTSSGAPRATTSCGAPMGGDNIVWGTDCGGADCDNVVWGTPRCRRQHRLGHGGGRRQHRVGHSDGGDNIVWGTSVDDASWASDAGDENNVTFPDTITEPLPSLDLEFGDVVPLPKPVVSGLSTLLGGL